MKLVKDDHIEQKKELEKRENKLTEKFRQYRRDLFASTKYKKMSCGSCYISKIISWARGENWRRNHQKSKK